MPASWLSWEPSEGSSEPFLPLSSSPSREDNPTGVNTSAVSRGVVVTMCRISRALSRPSEHARFLLTACEEVALLLRADSVLIAVLEPEGDALRIQPGFGIHAGEEGELLPLQGFAGSAMTSGALQLTQDIAADGRTERGRERAWHGVPGVAAPLQLGEHASGCILALRSPGGPAFGAGDLHRLAPVAEVIAAGLETLDRFGRARAGRVQLELERREAELRRWHERYSTAAAASACVVFEWDLARNTMLWGDTYASVFGAASEVDVSPLEQWLETVHPEDRGRARESLENAARDEAPLALTVRAAQGGARWRDVRLRECERLPGRDGPRLIGLAEKHGAPHESSVERESRARAEAATQVVRGLRHEINNPLAVVLGQAQLLRRESAVRDDPLLAPAVDAIYQESTRIQALVQRLGALEAGALPEPILRPRGGLNLPHDPDHGEHAGD
jgi:PAS domain-containing protein